MIHTDEPSPKAFTVSSNVMRVFSARPTAFMLAIMLAHIVLWTLVPALFHRGLPLDVIEGYAISKEWVWATHKHPALPYWILEVSRMVTGSVRWPPYFISSICAVATMAMAYRLGRDMTDEISAVAGALLLTGVIYFNWVTPEFNHNVAQMPAWAAVILCLWRARERGQLMWWAAVGVTAALGMHIKLSTAFLLIPAAAYICIDNKCQRQLATFGPWLGFAIFAVIVSPLLNVLVSTDFEMLNYAEARAQQKSNTIFSFVQKQLMSSAALGLIAIVAYWPHRQPVRPQRTDSTVEQPPPAGAFTFILTMHFAPICLMMCSAAYNGYGLKGAWGTSMASFTGLGIVLLARRFRIQLRFQRVALVAAVLTTGLPIAYAASVSIQDRNSQNLPRVSWPQQEIANRLQQEWREVTGRPLAIVAGDAWIAGLVSVHATDRPSLLLDGNLAMSPWLDRNKVNEAGVLAVWWHHSERSKPTMDLLTRNHHHRSITIEPDPKRSHLRQSVEGTTILYSILPPGTPIL